jgi:hypothetical protein
MLATTMSINDNNKDSSWPFLCLFINLRPICSHIMKKVLWRHSGRAGGSELGKSSLKTSPGSADGVGSGRV